MNTLNHFASGSFSSLIATLDRYHEAGIDPDFDTGMEELERQFAELRLAFGHN
jgi:hypothetical protein